MKKTLYAVTWVDDYGSYPLSKAQVRWFEENAGPLSLGLEMDERFPRPFARQLRQMRGDSGPPSHYFCHHYHPVRFKASRRAKRVYDFLKLRYLISFLVQALGILKPMKNRKMRGGDPLKYVRTLGIGLAVVLLAVVYYLGILKEQLLILACVSTILVGLTGLILYINQPRNWEHDFSNWEWNAQFLREIKFLFRRKRQRYAPVIRHGFNTPPASSMEFYMDEMQATADASATPTPLEGSSGRGSRRLHWQDTQPYYASMVGDYETPWNGLEEEERGILELPVNLGNIAQHGFGDFEKERIKQIPDRGLVSTFMHAWDDFSRIVEWVNYLKEKYDVRFVRADEYAKIFMRQDPRPVLIDRCLTPNWAFKKKTGLRAIREVDRDAVAVSPQNVRQNPDEIVLRVNTDRPVPEIYLDSFKVFCATPALDIELKNGGTQIRDIARGTYRLRLQSCYQIPNGFKDGQDLYRCSQVLS